MTCVEHAFMFISFFVHLSFFLSNKFVIILFRICVPMWWTCIDLLVLHGWSCGCNTYKRSTITNNCSIETVLFSSLNKMHFHVFLSPFCRFFSSSLAFAVNFSVLSISRSHFRSLCLSVLRHTFFYSFLFFIVVRLFKWIVMPSPTLPLPLLLMFLVLMRVYDSFILNTPKIIDRYNVQKKMKRIKSK